MPGRDPGATPEDGGVVLFNARVLAPPGILEPGWVAVAGERIEAVGVGSPPAVPRPRKDLGRAWLVPGFVDLHVHGGGGAWLSSADPDELGRAVRFHLSHGTTALLASIATAPLDTMLASVEAVAEAAAGSLAPVLAGCHLEGPFINKERCGAQDCEAILEPDAAVMRRLLDAGRGRVRTVTIAPERPGGLDLVRQVAEAGAVPAIGHTQATYAQASAAVAAGARLATHLFNAMRGLHHREPGTVGALLGHPEVVCEVINDGVHVASEAVTFVFRTVGARRVALITDALAAAGMPDGDYRFGRLPMKLRGGIATLGDGRTLAGSTLTMTEAVRRAVLEVGLSMEEAVAAASATPARVAGLDHLGTIEAGKRADLVVLDEDLRVVEVRVAGRVEHGGLGDWSDHAAWRHGAT